MTLREYFWYLLLLIFAPRSHKTMEWRMLRYLNRDRRQHGCPPVRMQQDLRLVARRHSRDMSEKNFFDHINKQMQSPSDRLKLAGVTEIVSGENLAMIGGYSSPTQKAEKGLMDSPGHRANILNREYNAVGIGVFQDRRRMYYFTQNFARRSLLFRKNFPTSIRLKHSLRVSGQAFASVKKIFWQIKFLGSPRIEKEGFCQLKGERFDFSFSFPEPGRYEVFFYVDREKRHQYLLANQFEIKVKRGFFG